MEPTTGARFVLEWADLHVEMFPLVVAAFAPACPDRLDTSGAHTASQLTLPEHVRRPFRPPECPEWNPLERGWRDLKDAMAWLQGATLEALQEELNRLLQGAEAATRQALPGVPDRVAAIHALHV